MKYQIEVRGNAVKIKTKDGIEENTYHTTIGHLVNLLEIEEYYNYAVKKEYEKKINNEYQEGKE